ncbi:MAG: N-acetylmuramic acid 6-phosphate etherase [Planctomycetota bacterium]
MSESAPLASTELANPLSEGIDQLDAQGIVDVIHRADAEVQRAIHAALPAIASLLEGVVERLRAGGSLLYIGAGTSGRLGVLDASECPPTYGVSPDLVRGIIAGGDGALRRSIEGAEDSREEGAAACAGITERDFVCGLAASGQTPFVWGALEEAAKRGAGTGVIHCNDRLELPAPVDHEVALAVGPEVITGSTRMKSGTATKQVLNMISTGSMIRLGKVYDHWMVDVVPSNRKLQARARRLIAAIGRVSEDEAQGYLDRADGRVKAAILMARRGVSAEKANALLERTQGHLRAAFDAD